MLYQIILFHGLLIRKNQVVHLPELSLLTSGQDGLMRQFRILVKRKRKVLKNPFDLTRVTLKKLLQGGQSTRAEWTFQIRKLDYCHQCTRRPAYRCAFGADGKDSL